MKRREALKLVAFGVGASALERVRSPLTTPFPLSMLTFICSTPRGRAACRGRKRAIPLFISQRCPSDMRCWPDLRVVIDHLPHAMVPSEDAARREYESNLRRLAESNHVFVKLSEIPVRTAGRLVTDPKYYEAALDGLWNIFGNDRMIFGSDWPNSDHVATYAETFAIASQYVAKKPHSIQEKYYWKNSIIAYRWRKRRCGQPVPQRHS